MKTSPFIEAIATDGNPTGLKWLIRVIKAGKSGNNNFYPASVLREATPMFNGSRVFVKSDAEHIVGGGKSFNQLIGQLSDARFVEAGGGEVQATLTLLASAGDVPAKLKEAFEAGMSDLFGFSIDAEAVTKKQGALREAVKFTKVNSVDLIIEPGAGGELVKLLEAIGDQSAAGLALLDIMLSAIKVSLGGNLPEGLDITNNEAVLSAYNQTLETSEEESYMESKKTEHPNTEPTKIDNEPDAADKLSDKIRLVEARAEARLMLKASDLPAPILGKLARQFNDTAVFTVEQVTEAIKEEREVLAKLTESGHVTGLGHIRIEAGADRSEKMTSMLDDFFDRSKRTMSFRECYTEITGDKGVTGLLQNCDTQKMREAVGGESFREAISTATFTNILSNSLDKAMLRDYQNLVNYDDWRDLVDVVPISNFRAQQRTRMGGYGNLPAVAQAAAYTALTSPTDEQAVYSIAKRGGTETITLETIANDDVGALRAIPQRMAVSAKRTLFEFVLDFLALNPLVYDAANLFNAATHFNLGTAALNNVSFAVARLAMKKQTEKNSLKRLGLVAKHIYVPAELEEMAFDMFVRNTNLDETFVQSRKPKVHVVDYWTDLNNWFVTADKMETPLIELGFFNGKEEPELFVQDLPTQGSLFSNDQIVYKIRHIYGGAVVDFRGFYGAIVP